MFASWRHCQSASGSFQPKSVEQFINDKLKSSLKVTSARNAFERFTSVPVKAGEGNPEVPFKFELPGWEDMRSGASIKGQPQGGLIRIQSRAKSEASGPPAMSCSRSIPRAL